MTTKLRKDEPLDLSVDPVPTFLSLPNEIQNEIYKLLLTTTKPVPVWHVQPRNIRRPFAAQAIICTLTSALLTTNKQISFDAAAVFYASNTFTFKGPQCWDPLYVFLSSIGATNRSHLRRLEVEVSEPEKLSLHPDGTVTTQPWSFWHCKVLARDSYPRNYSFGPDRHGEMEIEHLPPAIEASFRLLGPRQSAAPLQLLLTIQAVYIPGVVILHDMGETRYSMELPDHIERMKEEYIVGEGNDKSVEIKWRGGLRKTLFDPIANFEEVGWEILETKTIPGWEGPFVVFVMRRKKILRG